MDFCHRERMSDNPGIVNTEILGESATDIRPHNFSDIRPGEVAVALPPGTDAGVYFIGVIRTPWQSRADCPKRGAPDGPVCAIDVDPRWSLALTDLAGHRRIQVLYWMHRARRDLVLQTPIRTGKTTGCFALRSPVRPNPIASSFVALVAIEGMTLKVRGLDCIDGTPLIDLKPDHGSVCVKNEADAPTSK